MQATIRTWWFIVAASSVVLASCSNGPPKGNVTGEVMFAGQPVVDGLITFEPVDGQGQTAGAPIKEGKFEAQDVSVGKMKVRINGNKKTGRKIKAYDTPDSPVSDEIIELIPPRYNANTELTLDVKPGPQPVKYDLKK